MYQTGKSPNRLASLVLAWFVVCVGFLLTAQRAHAATTTTWISTSSSSFSTPGNWNTGAPTSALITAFVDSATIQHTISLGGAANSRNITFANYTGTNSAGFVFDTAGSTNLLTIGNALGIVNSDDNTQTFHNIVYSTTAMAINAGTGGLSFNELRLGNTFTLSGSSAITIGIDGGALVNYGGSRTLTNSSTGTVSIGAINLSDTAAAQTLTINGAGTATTVTGIIANGGGSTSGLTYSGSTLLILQGANTYDGTTTISSGTVRIENSAALGTTTGATTVASGATLALNSVSGISTGENLTIVGVGVGSAGAILNVAGDNTISGTIATTNNSTIGSTAGTLTLAGAISGTSDVITFAGAGNTTVSGQIGSTITNLIKTGTGALTLSNNTNAFTGTTTINGGTILSGASNVLTDTTAVTINSTTAGTTALLNLAGFNDTVASITFGGTGATSTSTNNVSTGSGTLTLGGNVIYTATNNPLGSTISGNLNLGTAARTFTIGNSTSATDDLTVSADIANTTGSIIKAGLGTLVLSGNNSFSGGVTLNATAGILAINSASALGTGTFSILGSVIDNTSGGDITLSTNNAQSWGANFTFTGTNNLNLGTGGVTLTAARQVTVTNNTLTVGGVITDGASTFTLTKAGAGTLLLTGANTYTGATTVSAGTLALANNTALGDGVAGTSVTSGATLALQGGISATNGILTINGTGGGNGALQNTSGNNTYNNNITLGSASTIMSSSSGETLTLGTYNTHNITLAGFALTFDGAGNTTVSSNLGVAASGSLVKNGLGTLTMQGFANVYTGTTTVNAGTLILDTANSQSDKAILGNLTIGVGGAGAADSVLVRYGSGSADNKIANTSQVTINSDGKLSLNNRNDTIGSFILAGGHIDSGTGLLTLAGNITTNTNTANRTALIDGNMDFGGSVRTFTVANGSLSSDLTMNAVLTSGGIIKAGAGIMTITSDNTIGYAGTTSVNAGTLVITDSDALGGHGVNDSLKGTTVLSGATLRLDGTAAGVTVGQETLSLSGTGDAAHSAGGALDSTAGTNSYAGTVTLAGNATISTTTGSDLTISGDFTGTTQTATFAGGGNTTLSGAIGTGTGGIIMNGTGVLTLSGTTTSTYTGGTSINSGTVILDKTAGLNAAGSGAITVGDSAGGANTAILQLNQDNQIANSTAITINADGKMDLNGHSETIGTLAGTGAGTLAIGTGALTLSGAGNTSYSGLITAASSGSLIKDLTSTGTTTLSNASLSIAGNVTVLAGILEFSGAAPIISGTLTLGANSTLRLTGSNLTVGTIHITGDTVIDFGAASTSILNSTTLTIDSGVGTVSIINWLDGTDFFQSTIWTNATLGTRGLGPELQVTFNGYSNSATAWLSYDHQITPVPEPGTYGLILSGLATALVALRKRFRK